MQPHNRHMSMSYYLAAIALADTFVLLIGEYYHFWFLKTKMSKSEVIMCHGNRGTEAFPSCLNPLTIGNAGGNLEWSGSVLTAS